MRTVTVEERRALMVRRHRLDGAASTPEEATRAVVALHATDPASVYLSVLARSRASTLADVGAAMYDRRALVRWMAMRRTLFVLPVETVPVVQAAVSTPLAAALRRQLVSRITRNGTDPGIDGDPGGWLDAAADAAVVAVRDRGSATGAQVAADVAALRTIVLPGAPSERPQRLTSALLTMVSAQGRIVRGSATGAWTSRHHLWEDDSRWPTGGASLPTSADAEGRLAYAWFERFGPATPDDLRWWTGWNATTTRRALGAVPLVEVDLHGVPGLDLDPADRDEEPWSGTGAPVLTLLPALDPTPMGWRHRDWYLPADRSLFFDTAGNIGPTIWWDGEVIGAWAVSTTGEVRTALVADRGADASAATDDAAARLERRLDGAVVVPTFHTPLERRITGDSDRDR